MAFFISSMNGLYYEGDRELVSDMEVAQRPSSYHTYKKKLKQWVLDEDKVASLRSRTISMMEESLKMKAAINNLSDSEKKALEEELKKKVEEVTKATDPSVIEKITL